MAGGRALGKTVLLFLPQQKHKTSLYFLQFDNHSWENLFTGHCSRLWLATEGIRYPSSSRTSLPFAVVRAVPWREKLRDTQRDEERPRDSGSSRRPQCGGHLRVDNLGAPRAD